MKPLIDADEAVRLLGLRSRGSLYGLVARGHVPAIKLGPRILRFAPDELESLKCRGERLETQRTRPRPVAEGRSTKRSSRTRQATRSDPIEQIREKGARSKRSR